MGWKGRYWGGGRISILTVVPSLSVLVTNNQSGLLELNARALPDGTILCTFLPKGLPITDIYGTVFLSIVCFFSQEFAIYREVPLVIASHQHILRDLR